MASLACDVEDDLYQIVSSAIALMCTVTTAVS
jgi:hypothetical protein